MKAKQFLWKLSLVFVSMLFVLATAFGLLNFRETKTVKASSGSVSVYMLDGASIRYDGANSGIRFTAYVSESSLTAGTDVTVGMTIASETKTWERTSDADTWQWATSDVAGYKKFQVALTGIPDTDYGTELTATAWVDVDGVKTNATAQTRSIARVANACLAENELLKELGSEEVLTDTKVSTLDGYTAGEALASVSAIEMNNNSFAWSEVANATGYFVGFSGEVVHVIGGETVPVSAFGKIATPVDGVSVIAYGNGVDNTYGEVVSGNVLLTELANFSDENNGTISGLEGGYVFGTAPYRTEPFYEDGTVKAGIKLDRYHVGGGSSLLAAFKVTLPTGLDLTEDGIVVKVQLYDRSNVAAMDRFTLLSKDGQKSWQNGTSADFPGVAMTYQEWMEVRLSSAELQTMGYATGDTELYFGGWNAATASVGGSNNPGMWFQLDDISYYGGEFSLDTPTDLAVSTKGLITWSEVTNADGYTVDIDGTQYETTTNSYKIEEFTSDVTVRVQAISNGNAWAASAWTEVIATDYFTLASFADANNGTLVNISGYGWADYKATPVYANGTATAGFYLDRYHEDGGSTKLAAFKVVLPTGLDLTMGGIVVKALLVDYSDISGATPDKFTLLTKEGQKSWQNTTDITTFPNVTMPTDKTTWMELKVSSAELAALGYATGDTELYFGGWYTATTYRTNGTSMKFQLDDISYYRVPTLDTPENVTVSDTGLIEWTEVTNADGYVVEIDGTEYTSNTNSYQIQAFAKDVTVRVRAISNGEYWAASAWTEEVTTDCFTLATFADENNGTVDYVQGVKNNKFRVDPAYADGVVSFAAYLDSYDNTWSVNLSAFQVELSKGLDLSKSGIILRVNISSHSGTVSPTHVAMLPNVDKAEWDAIEDITTLPNTEFTAKGTWMDLKVSSADLTTLGYANGDTTLSFGGWVKTAIAQNGGGAAIWYKLDDISYYQEYTVEQLAEQIAYGDTQAMEYGAYIAPTSAILTNWNGTAYNADNIYQAAGLNSFNIVVDTSSIFEGGVELALTRCGWATIDAYIQLHNEMTASVDGWTKFQEIFNGVDLTEYPALKGFFIADEPSWTQMEIIETYYVPWFNENYAKSGLEFCVNLLGGYSTAMGELRDENGNSLGTYEGTEEEYRVCHTAYVNEWLGIFATVKSSNKYLTLDCYPLMDNQEDLLTELDGSNLPEDYERVLYDDWLRRSMNMANFARDNGHAFGAFIQAFDEGWTDSARTYRLPTKVEEIKWQAYMNIALGAKRLMYYGFDARSGGHYMTASGAQPTAIYNFVQATNAELATLDHVFMAFDTWVGAKTFIPSGATASTAIAGVADIELGALTNVSGVTTSGELVVGEMVDNHGNHGYMLVGYNDPFDGVSTEVSMTFDGADGFIVYRAGDNVRTFVKDTNGLLSLTLGACEGVFVIPVYAK